MRHLLESSSAQLSRVHRCSLFCYASSPGSVSSRCGACAGGNLLFLDLQSGFPELSLFCGVSLVHRGARGFCSLEGGFVVVQKQLECNLQYNYFRKCYAHIPLCELYEMNVLVGTRRRLHASKEAPYKGRRRIRCHGSLLRLFHDCILLRLLDSVSSPCGACVGLFILYLIGSPRLFVINLNKNPSFSLS